MTTSNLPITTRSVRTGCLNRSIHHNCSLLAPLPQSNRTQRLLLSSIQWLSTALWRHHAASRTVVQAAFAVMDDHNNTLVQENQDIHHSWPYAATSSVCNRNRGLPDLYINTLPDPATYLNPLVPYASLRSTNPHNKIPYSMEYNAGIEQQLSNSMVLDLDYVGSLGRHQFEQPVANTAPTPGPGTLASRGRRLPQYGGPFSFDMNAGEFQLQRAAG